MKMKQFYLDIEVTQKRRLRVDFSAKKKPTPEEMFEIMQNDGDNVEITDEEDLELISVDSIGEGEADD